MTKLELDAVYRNMPKDRIVEALKKLRKADVSEFVNCLGIRLQKNASKYDYINAIASYYSFQQLNDRITQRNA